MSEQRLPQTAVLGAGIWGVALAQILCENGCAVRCWDFYPEVIDGIKAKRLHPRLPEMPLHSKLELTADLAAAMDGAEVAVLVVPSTAVRSTCEALRERNLSSGVRLWVLCSKGIEVETLLPLHHVVEEVLGADAAGRLGVLSGPTIASEVARRLPTTITASAGDPEIAREIQRLFFQPRFRVYTQRDMLGAELGGALKNVIAIAAGIADGMGFGDNSRAALITRGLAEIVRLADVMGAERETFMGLSGMGDLIVTTTSKNSRNHTFGEYLAEGKSCSEALDAVGMVVEGCTTAKSAHALAKKHGVEMPISEAVYRVIYEDMPAREALELLLSRDPKPERV